MNDAELLAGFEGCTLDPRLFDHRAHVRVAWIYLRRGSLLEALERFSRGLLRFASSHGKAAVYHETITWAFVFVIHERMLQMPREHDFDAFAAANPDLFAWPLDRSVIATYYREETLASELSRRTYLLPDRAAR